MSLRMLMELKIYLTKPAINNAMLGRYRSRKKSAIWT